MYLTRFGLYFGFRTTSADSLQPWNASRSSKKHRVGTLNDTLNSQWVMRINMLHFRTLLLRKVVSDKIWNLMSRKRHNASFLAMMRIFLSTYHSLTSNSGGYLLTFYQDYLIPYNLIRAALNSFNFLLTNLEKMDTVICVHHVAFDIDGYFECVSVTSNGIPR